METEILIEKLHANDHDTFVLIMKTYNKLLWVIVGSILSHVGTPQDIEECISDVYVKLWENPKIYNSDKGSLKTFLSSMARNKALDK